ncbi:MAG: VPS10 domain-containing protein [Thermoanaerobaculia bacterium]
MKQVSAAVALLSLLLAGGPVHAAKTQKVDKKGKADKSANAADAKKDEKKEKLSAGTFAGLELRGIGPALTSGRVIDIAVDPKKPSTWYIAVASGGVWKTTNGGASFNPIFEGQPSYSIGCITIDPNNPLVIWVGSGENNSQRSVAYGDGVYKSLDGGKTWTNMGLKSSEHIGKIVVDPRDSDTVYVAAQGPLWNAGGDRGLYKTTDGGKTWKAVLTISENTGVTDVAMDPRDSDVLYAASYQRRRHVWTLINGGPEAAVYKSMDGGANWKKIEAGLPKEEKGRIGLAIAPSAPDTVYAIVEAARGAGGFFRSRDGGANWERRGKYFAGSAQYYQEIFVDPYDADRVYSMDVFVQLTEDGGKTWRNLGERFKHVDNHAIWIDPANTDHLLVGCDGGLYESYDRGATWMFKANLPVTQFYRVSLDNDMPFYNVYGGTQDNFSLGGPSRTITNHGIINADWFITNGGDGFETVVDPTDPNIIYAEAQHAGIVRFDRKSGESVDIQPQPGPGEDPLRYNWDSPLMISPHSHTRLYLAAQRLFRSDDRGNSWRAVSPDLTRRIDRNKLKVMGKVWNIDAVAKSASTSFYGNIVSLSESPKKEDLLYIGTDDGLIQVTDDAGANWRKIEKFPGIPENTYVSDLEASGFDDSTVYASFDNHKLGDFKPYVLKSTDRGKSWTSIAGDLPAKGTVYALAEDFVDRDLLFAGTEFGIFFTVDGGKKWIPLSGGMPTIAIRDIALHQRENDLVLATFGRGFYILDDYTPLRQVRTEADLEKDAILFPVKKTWMFIEASPLGLPGKAFQGETLYTAPNPPFGAVFTYYLKEDLKTRKKMRWEAEAEVEKEGGNVEYPKWEDLRAEEREKEPVILLTVTDAEGQVVRRITAPAAAGMHRVAWDLRYPSTMPASLGGGPTDNPFFQPPQGPLAAPGKYTVTLAKRIGDMTTPLGEPQTFEAEPLANTSLPATDRRATLDFQRKVANLQRAVAGAASALEEGLTRVELIQKALLDTPAADPKMLDEARKIEDHLRDLNEQLTGDPVKGEHNEPTSPAIADRVFQVVGGAWGSTSAPTQTHQNNYTQAAEAFAPLLADIRKSLGEDLVNLENRMEAAGAPWTPSRIPEWKPE